MFYTKHRQLIRWGIILMSFIIITLILWNTYVFFQEFKEEEAQKMNVWATAQIEFQKSALDEDINPVIDLVITSENTNPMFVVTSDGKLSVNNLKKRTINSEEDLDTLINEFKNQNPPIDLEYTDPKTKEKIDLGKLYYGDSEILSKLKYYPLALLLIIVLFGTVVYLFYSSTKNAAQNKLWTGMAKETAHQIGTPLSSLIGWTEILKIENVNPEYIIEIEKDISRLQTITERFSKIGSLPALKQCDIIKETQATYDYLKTRSSKLINFSLHVPETPVFVLLNAQLYSWTLENLVKNAIDAMRGKGDLTVIVEANETTVKIKVIDIGKGLAKSEFNTIFDPGYTSKKRGWGLGLSLAKRIIEDFHNGKIKVKHSEIGKGTTMQITLKSL
ncbi:HAMP domain-containing histidine kinase [Bizionia gelidisalsuginis]|uniref:histidine kinase n=2 Tax=Bizionia TaxID=283785 RepID=A0A8H2LD38_9FLAO|nr:MULTISPECIES: HAMP domain-containing sensor histidine kinase [Bizionia]TYB70688.1 HAMP domain-containing histidine kinase [Bizionia saleffrena]TYC10184.1 HAMP domain-containing histidine kinase [Bizionia gelidisalsuginis]